MRHWSRNRQPCPWHWSGNRNWSCYWRHNVEVQKLNFAFDREQLFFSTDLKGRFGSVADACDNLRIFLDRKLLS
jgi:hypothetical protein